MAFYFPRLTAAAVDCRAAQAVLRGFQVFARVEVMRSQHLLDPPVETLNQAVGLRVLRRGQVLDAQVAAPPIELVLAGGAAFAQAEQAVGELLAVACWE